MNPQDTIAKARQYLGSQDFNNFCEAFVEKVTGSPRYASAIQAWNNANNKVQGTSGLKAGDRIYFSPNAGNQNYGHTGIALDNGQFLSATPSGVKVMNLADWQKQTGQQVLGYIPGQGQQTVQAATAHAPVYHSAIQLHHAANQVPQTQATPMRTQPIAPVVYNQSESTNQPITMPQAVQNP